MGFQQNIFLFTVSFGLDNATFLLKIFYLTDFKSNVNSIQDSAWNFVLSLLDLGAFLGCVHEHVNSVEAEMNSCDFYWNICLFEKMILTDDFPV